MRSNQEYGKSFTVIAILFVFIYGVAATSVANVPEGETKKYDTSVKGHNADSHPVGDLTIAQGQQLTGDELGFPQSIGKGHRTKGQNLTGDELGFPRSTGKGHRAKPKKLKTKSKTKNRGVMTGEIPIFGNKAKVHGSPFTRGHDKSKERSRKK